MTAPSAFDELLAAARSRTLPPVERWNPSRVGEIDIRIAANGDWYHDGSLIKRFAIAKLFATILRRDRCRDDGLRRDRCRDDGLRRDRCRDDGLRRDRCRDDGLRRDRCRDDGQYFLVTPAEKLRIRVDDAPFLAIDMESDGQGDARRLLFTTNVGDVVLADAAHPLTVVTQPNGEPRPYVEVRDGLTALIARSVFYRLAELADVDENGAASICSAGARFVLGRAD